MQQKGAALLSRRGTSGVTLICDNRPADKCKPAIPPGVVESQYVGNYIGACCDSAATTTTTNTGSCESCNTQQPSVSGKCCQQQVDTQCVGAPITFQVYHGGNPMGVMPCPAAVTAAAPVIDIRPPRQLEDMKLVKMRKDVMWQWRFTMNDIIRDMPGKLYSSLSATAQAKLGDAGIPSNVILDRVSLLETSNDSFVEFGIDADWINEKGFVTAGGQRFTGYVADDVRVFHPKDRVLFRATEEDRKEAYRLLPLTGMLKEDLIRGVVQSGGNVTIPSGTYLYELICTNCGTLKKAVSQLGISIAKEAYETVLEGILGDVDLAKKHVTKPAHLGLHLTFIKPANPTKETMLPAELLNLLVGEHAKDEQSKQYYLDKMNKINVVLRLEYYVPVPQ